MKRFLSFMMLVFLSVAGLSAKSWFVCAGSFSKIENAEALCKNLSENDLSCFISDYIKNDGTVLYRVLIYDDYPFADDARSSLDKITENPYFVKNGISGLWICEGVLPAEDDEKIFIAVPKAAPVSEPIVEEVEEPVMEVVEEEPVLEETEKPKIEVPASVFSVLDEGIEEAEAPEDEVVLESNEENKLSEERPYSVLVRSYREEEKAVYDRDRMKANNLDAYILKKYDSKSLFSFDLHSGAFKTEEEAEEHSEYLESKGIRDTEISDYEEIAEQIEAYDEMVSERKVALNNGTYEIPVIFSENVKANISQFPINRNFQIEKVKIVDLENAEDYYLKMLEDDYDFNDFLDYEEITAISYAEFKDTLAGKDLYMYIIQSDEGSSEYLQEYFTDEMEMDDGDFFETDFLINYGNLHSFIKEMNGDYCLYGYTDDKKILIAMDAKGFTQDEFIDYMRSFYNDSSLLVYPQIRRSFQVILSNEKVERKLMSYNLETLGQEYVYNKNEADWAKGIAGHRVAETIYDQDGEFLVVGVYDLDYDFNAKKVHRMFIDEKEWFVDENTNHSEIVNGTVGWYIDTSYMKELSFSNGSFIIAADFLSDAEQGLPELHDIADELDIWATEKPSESNDK